MPSELSWTLLLLQNPQKLCVSPEGSPVVLVGFGSCFFIGQPDDLAYALAPWPFPDLFLGHSEDCFDSDGTDCDLPRVGYRAPSLVESFDLQGIEQDSQGDASFGAVPGGIVESTQLIGIW
jgi:hypothetical protein